MTFKANKHEIIENIFKIKSFWVFGPNYGVVY
jgi:hypothetical protein